MSATAAESPEDRLLVALDPSPEVRNLVAYTIGKFAAELAAVGLADALDEVAESVENPAGLLAVEVVERAGITYRQLDYWTAMGYLSAIDGRAGSGHPRSYLPREAVKARLMGSIVAALEAKAGTAAVLAEDILRRGAAHAGEFTIVRTSA